MYENMHLPPFRNVHSTISKTFLGFLIAVAIFWIVGVLDIVIQLIFSEKVSDYWNRNRLQFSAVMLLSCILLGSFLAVYKEPFYTHIIIDNEGLTFFNKYQYRPAYSIPWTALTQNPEGTEADIQQKRSWDGSRKIIFRTTAQGQIHTWEESFGGYGLLPFLYTNRTKLQKVFLTGVCQFRKDLRLDPALLKMIGAKANG